MLNTLFLVLWSAAGVGVGLFLGWWQSRSIVKFENSAPEKMMARVYLHSIPRILLVSGLLFAAMLQGIWYGICFASGFTLSRWMWTLITLKIMKAKDS